MAHGGIPVRPPAFRKKGKQGESQVIKDRKPGKGRKEPTRGSFFRELNENTRITLSVKLSEERKTNLI